MTYLEAGIEVIKLLESNGYEAYFVGGFVRDKLLNHECNDIDIATNALPEAVSTIFNVLIIVLKCLWWIICLPFKAIKFIIEKIKRE